MTRDRKEPHWTRETVSPPGCCVSLFLSMTDDPRVSWNTPDSTPRLATLQLRNNPTQEHSGLLYTVSIVSKLPGDGL